jgi:hypothetical protein
MSRSVVDDLDATLRTPEKTEWSVWTPDGKPLSSSVRARGRAASATTFAMKPDGSGRRYLLKGPNRSDEHPKFAPAGCWFARHLQRSARRPRDLGGKGHSFSLGDQDAVLELTYNHDCRTYDLGSGYGHIAIGVDDLDGTLSRLKEQGIEPERPPYSVPPLWQYFSRLPRVGGRLHHSAQRRIISVPSVAFRSSQLFSGAPLLAPRGLRRADRGACCSA